VDDGLTWEQAKERRDTARDELIGKDAPPDRLKRVSVAEKQAAKIVRRLGLCCIYL